MPASSARPQLPADRPGAGRRRALGKLAVERLLPGVGRVSARVPEFATAWARRNAAARRGSEPLWVALGDSMSQGIGAQSIDGGWVGQLHAQLLAEGHALRLLNLSSTGARVRDVVEQQLPQLADLVTEAVLVTVLVGANDMFPRSRWPEAVAAYPQVLDGLPAGRAVVGTMPRRNAAANAINALIDAAAAEGRVRAADMRGMTLRSLIGTRAEDHFHPNERGYGDIARRFAVAVDRSTLLR